MPSREARTAGTMSASNVNPAPRPASLYTSAVSLTGNGSPPFSSPSPGTMPITLTVTSATRGPTTNAPAESRAASTMKTARIWKDVAPRERSRAISGFWASTSIDPSVMT